MKKLKTTKRGVTLVEMMVVVAIVGIISSIAPVLLKNITKFFRLNTARIETQRAARDTMERVNQTLRQAYSSSIVISQETGQPPASSISFSTVDGRSLKYYQSNKTLYFVVNSSTRAFADGLLFISFDHPRTDDSTILSVSLTYEKATFQGGSKTLQMAIEKVRIMN